MPALIDQSQSHMLRAAGVTDAQIRRANLELSRTAPRTFAADPADPTKPVSVVPEVLAAAMRDAGIADDLIGRVMTACGLPVPGHIGPEPATFSDAHQSGGTPPGTSQFLRDVCRPGGVLDRLAPRVAAKYRT